jgi:hypothetical protein
MHPQPGDVLVSRSSGNVEHQISVVPDPPRETCPTHTCAVDRANTLARERGVDAWLTEDLIHFMRLVSCRTDRAAPQGRQG